MWSEVLFDLDGTLTDPGDGITNSARYAMEALGYPVPPRAELERFIGPPLHEAFAEICGFDNEQVEAAVTAFRAYFARQGIWENQVFPGMAALLADLKGAGRRLFVATSKPVEFARQVLERFKLAPYFELVAGSDLTHEGRAKADIVAEVLREGGVNPKTAVMVGDRLYDVAGAHANGLACVGVAFGYGGRAELERAGAEFIVDDMAALRQVLLG